MRIGVTASRSATPISNPVAWRYISPSHIKKLSWLVMFVAMLAMNLVHAHAAKQKPDSRKDTSKGRPTPTAPAAQKRATPQPRKTLLHFRLPEPVDPFERREHMVHRVRPGESFADILSRYGLAGSEKQLWMRSLTRDSGRRPLPVGREIHLYFAQPTLTRSKRGVPGQLKALEFDHDEAYTLPGKKT